ncbi:MAG: CAAX prenyl protease-related protein [Methylotenera sp.]|uniref:CAAX prenyl protease-related protein n=1 Tax=Methylotenera sp. TaxID=2051956 RepID=UPI0027160B89|nr:CAAX prenyl protease-related protein [Methylotenera sp.]MDO9149920.1 CAAX prenyl protease-related protein [Methylotenera sp.]
MTNKYAIFSRILPFALYILFIALGDYFTLLLNAVGLDEKLVYGIKVISVLALLFYFWGAYTELAIRPKLIQLFNAFVAGIAVLLVWILPYPEWATLGGDVKGVNPFLTGDSFSAYIWLSMRIFGAAMIVPLMEELFWRSFLMRWLVNQDFLSVNPAKISAFAIIISACVFALEHHLWLAGLFSGLVYALLYKIYKNLWVPIFAHAVTNGLLGLWIVMTGNWWYW